MYMNKPTNPNPCDQYLSDKDFLLHMIPHHQVAVDMCNLMIQISKSKSLLFTVSNEILEIEKGIYLGGKKILDNTCITISGNLVNKSKSFNWEIKKNI